MEYIAHMYSYQSSQKKRTLTDLPNLLLAWFLCSLWIWNPQKYSIISWLNKCTLLDILTNKWSFNTFFFQLEIGKQKIYIYIISCRETWPDLVATIRPSCTGHKKMNELTFTVGDCVFGSFCLLLKWLNDVSLVNTGHALGIWICRCSLFYRRELWASKSAGVNST